MDALDQLITEAKQNAKKPNSTPNPSAAQAAKEQEQIEKPKVTFSSKDRVVLMETKSTCKCGREYILPQALFHKQYISAKRAYHYVKVDTLAGISTLPREYELRETTTSFCSECFPFNANSPQLELDLS